MFYSESGSTIMKASRAGICQGTFEIVAQEVLSSTLGSHHALWCLPLPNVTWHSGTWSYICDTLHLSDMSLNRDLVTELDLIAVFDVIAYFREVSTEYLQRVWQDNMEHLLLRTPGPVPFGTYICSNVETIIYWTCNVYGPFVFRTSRVTSLLLPIPQYTNSTPPKILKKK